jgi:hypothetical protein
MGIDACAIDIQLYFKVTSLSQRTAARNDVIDLVYRHCNANSLVLSMPPGIQILQDGQMAAPKFSALTLLGSITLFSDLTEEERASISAKATERKVAAGEELLPKGAISNSLLIIREGVALRRDQGEVVARLAPGDILGAWGVLAGQPENTQSLTLTPVTLYEFQKSVFDDIFAIRPDLVDGLTRRLHRHGSHSEGGPPATIQPDGARADLVHAIRSMFGGR